MDYVEFRKQQFEKRLSNCRIALAILTTTNLMFLARSLGQHFVSAFEHPTLLVATADPKPADVKTIKAEPPADSWNVNVKFERHRRSGDWQ